MYRARDPARGRRSVNEPAHQLSPPCSQAAACDGCAVQTAGGGGFGNSIRQVLTTLFLKIPPNCNMYLSVRLETSGSKYTQNPAWPPRGSETTASTVHVRRQQRSSVSVCSLCTGLLHSALKGFAEASLQERAGAAGRQRQHVKLNDPKVKCRLGAQVNRRTFLLTQNTIPLSSLWWESKAQRLKFS